MVGLIRGYVIPRQTATYPDVPVSAVARTEPVDISMSRNKAEARQGYVRHWENNMCQDAVHAIFGMGGSKNDVDIHRNIR